MTKLLKIPGNDIIT